MPMMREDFACILIFQILMLVRGNKIISYLETA